MAKIIGDNDVDARRDVHIILHPFLHFMSTETKDTVCVKANVNETAMVQFAKSYAPDVEILEPVELREQVKEELRKGYRVYE